MITKSDVTLHATPALGEGKTCLPLGYSELMASLPQQRMCARTALPVVLAMSAVVTLWTLAFTLKVTADPTTLERETI